jgi:hypothetical protein
MACPRPTGGHAGYDGGHAELGVSSSAPPRPPQSGCHHWELYVELSVLHKSADTGPTLTESIHDASLANLVTGERSVTGQTWSLLDEDGQPLFCAGRIATAGCEIMVSSRVFHRSMMRLADGDARRALRSARSWVRPCDAPK